MTRTASGGLKSWDLRLAVNPWSPMHAGQGSEGHEAGGDPTQNTDCTFANRFFQTMVSTANKPEFFSAGVAGLLCWGGGSGWIPLSVSRSFYPSGYCWPRGGGLGQTWALG